jgi:RsiW-degrading membrane proteinase PrsW (M82 family)
MSSVNVAVALAPVVAFLLALQLMDSFKLVRPSSVGRAIVAGAVAALVSWALHHPLQQLTGLGDAHFSRYLAPIVEETLKALFIVVLIVRRRIGFLVDAAVQGFAVGTGFALVENVTYLQALGDAPLMLWLVRGLGTAVLHGATMAIFGMLSRTFFDRHPDRLWYVFWPGWAAAVAIHSTFNHVPLPPVAMTALLLIILPLLVLQVFQRSETATREWVGAGLDLDMELLQLVQSEAFGFTRFGTYLRELRRSFPGPTVADMFCLLRLELELSVQAKAMLMAREAGLAVPVDDDLGACLAEVEYLNASIGRTGMLALKPLRVSSHRDEWHRFLLQQTGKADQLKAHERARRLTGLLKK